MRQEREDAQKRIREYLRSIISYLATADKIPVKQQNQQGPSYCKVLFGGFVYQGRRASRLPLAFILRAVGAAFPATVGAVFPALWR